MTKVKGIPQHVVDKVASELPKLPEGYLWHFTREGSAVGPYVRIRRDRRFWFNQTVAKSIVLYRNSPHMEYVSAAHDAFKKWGYNQLVDEFWSKP